MVTTSETDQARRSAGESSIDDSEIARFAAIADSWWDPDGKFRPLHKLNPVRVEFVRDRLAAHFGRDPLAKGGLAKGCLEGLRILDVGCGGGLLCEPLARLGATVVGIDATEQSIDIARAHAEQSGLDIDYRHGAVEELVAAGEPFDAVLCLEVVEHVAEPGPFVADCCALARPGGALVLSTLNRTAKAFAFGIVGAEYVLRWLPRGTHQWRKFLRPSELSRFLRQGGGHVEEISGVSYDVLTDSWRLGRDLSVNYMVFATKG